MSNQIDRKSSLDDTGCSFKCFLFLLGNANEVHYSIVAYALQVRYINRVRLKHKRQWVKTVIPFAFWANTDDLYSTTFF